MRVVEAELDEKGLGHYYMQAPSEPGPRAQGTGESLGECQGLCLTNGLYITCRHQVSLGLELKGLERALASVKACA